MIKKSGLIFSVVFLSASLLYGCSDESENVSCAEKGESFFTQSLKSYFEKQGKIEQSQRFEVLNGARYNDKLNWWVVPLVLDGKRMEALLSCDGNLELSIPSQ